MSAQPKAVVLLSGGLDSTTVLALAKNQGFAVYALTCRYGQRHEVEIEAARRIAAYCGAVQHAVAEFDLRRFGAAALTSDIAVPKGRTAEEMAHGIPVTYCQHAIPSSCRSPWPGPRCSQPTTSLLVLTL
jgi:7-cyano-7-deazaguanine synthase